MKFFFYGETEGGCDQFLMQATKERAILNLWANVEIFSQTPLQQRDQNKITASLKAEIWTLKISLRQTSLSLC